MDLIERERKERIKETLEKQKFDYHNPPEEKAGLINVIDRGNEIPVLYRQGILVVYGKPKSRKSTFLSIMGAAAYKGEKVGKIRTEVNGKILWFDTEQAGVEFYNLQKRMYDMCGVEETDRILSYSLVAFGNKQDRLEAIKLALEEHGGETDLLVIDGIKDLLLDSGDESEANRLLDELRALEVKYDCGLVTVIHTGKSGEDLVNRLGTLLSEKLSYGFKIVSDSAGSVISAGYSRGKEFQEFRINQNKDGTVEFTNYHDPMRSEQEMEDSTIPTETARKAREDADTDDALPF